MNQLDIFEDSRDTMLRNDLARAVIDGDAVAAQRIADALEAEFGADPMLAPAARLIEFLRWQQAHAAAGRLDVASVLEARRAIDTEVAPAAEALLGAADASSWLGGPWRWLAGMAAHVGWHPDRSDAHCAGHFLRSRDWRLAATAVAGIESWRRIPQPLLWMAEARWHADGADAAWPLLAEALWMAPARAAALLQALPDPILRRLLPRFEECFDPVAGSGDDWAWLPAFALVDSPLLAGPLAPAEVPAQSAPGQAFQVAMALLRLERQGRHREIVAQRARLKSL
jgi:hypothetical protein